MSTIESIPSRNSAERPQTSFNEGGENCFDKDSLWFKLYQLSKQQVNNKNIKDVFELGGTTPKNILTFDDFHSKIIWKPQIARRNDSKHYDSSFNEVVYFHFDCLLGIQRTPPAISFSLPFNPFFFSLSDQSKSNYDEREIDWEVWRSSGEVPGVAQVYVEAVHHVDILVEYSVLVVKKIAGFFHIDIQSILGATDVTIREYAQRDMVDFVLGNWDRLHNQFYVEEPNDRGEMITKLIYLDHNHLKISYVLSTFKLTHCKFWYSTVERLKDLYQKGIFNSLNDSLAREELKEISLMGGLQAPLIYANRRAFIYFNHVDKCVEEHGFESVFGFPYSPSFISIFTPPDPLPFQLNPGM